MKDLFNLLKVIYAIRFYTKDIHYKAIGENFWADHLMADRIYDGLDDFIDDINENLYMGFEEDTPYSKDVLEAVIKSIPELDDDMNRNWESLYGMIVAALEIINNIEKEYEMPQINSLLDSLVNDLQKKKGLIWRRIGVI